MTLDRIWCFAWVFVLAASTEPLPALAQGPNAPYGTARFSAYSDIDDLKQLKVVWDSGGWSLIECAREVVRPFAPGK
jgi:hypothetical protein